MIKLLIIYKLSIIVLVARDVENFVILSILLLNTPPFGYRDLNNIDRTQRWSEQFAKCLFLASSPVRLSCLCS